MKLDKEKKVEVMVYRLNNGLVECLCLKRSAQDGGFWHVVVGTIEGGEAPIACIKRELAEELGINDVAEISDVLNEWLWERDGQEIAIFDYAARVSGEQVILNDEHTDFCWLSPARAVEKLEKESGKRAVSLLENYLHKK